MNKMAAPTGQHGKYLFWLQLLNRLSDFHTVFTDDLRKRSSLFPDQGDWCHSSPLSKKLFSVGRVGNKTASREVGIFFFFFPNFNFFKLGCTGGGGDGGVKKKKKLEKMGKKSSSRPF